HLSSDAGAHWTNATAGSRAWAYVASSADGQVLMATEDGGLIYTSADGGAHWAPQNSGGSIRCGAAVSSDGNRMWALDDAGGLHDSADAGVTWTVRSIPNLSNFISASADFGQIVTGGEGPLFTSSDAGISWTATSFATSVYRAGWMSPDGIRIMTGG